MARFGFVGPSYTSESPNVDAQKTMNWYPEIDELGQGKSATALYPTPGTQLFCNLTGSSVIGITYIKGRCFAVTSTTNTLWEILSNGTSVSRGTVLTTAGRQASFGVGNFEMLVVSGGHAYSFKYSDNSLVDETASLAQPDPIMAGFSDGYFVVLFNNSNEFQISALEDSRTWSGLDVGQVSVFADNVISMLVDHREIWLFGSKKTQP